MESGTVRMNPQRDDGNDVLSPSASTRRRWRKLSERRFLSLNNMITLWLTSASLPSPHHQTILQWGGNVWDIPRCRAAVEFVVGWISVLSDSIQRSHTHRRSQSAAKSRYLNHAPHPHTTTLLLLWLLWYVVNSTKFDSSLICSVEGRVIWFAIISTTNSGAEAEFGALQHRVLQVSKPGRPRQSLPANVHRQTNPIGRRLQPTAAVVPRTQGQRGEPQSKDP